MLSPTQITKFRTDGYLVLPDIIPKDILVRLKSEYADLINDLYAGWYKQGLVKTPPQLLGFWEKLLCAYQAGCDYFQPMDISLPGDRIKKDTPFHIGPAVFDMLTAKPLLDAIEQLIGPEITSNPIQHVRIKPPETKLNKTEIRPHIAATDWHQDRAVALEEADQTDMITAWIAITNATVENGCLQVKPQTKNQTILPHCPRTQTGIAEGFISETDAISLPISAGGAVLFHPLTPHRSLRNTTEKFRWSFDIRYNATGQSTGRGHFPDFIARSRSSPKIELRDWKTCKSRWEDARARLSQTPHINIHRWSSDAPYCA
jgi:phytanoyl-CoA hydroxylase